LTENTTPDERPTPIWGSDAIADLLRSTGSPYIALNPGASYRGLHDSLVNHLGDESPQILMTLHEEHAVAIAHGYAKLSGDPLLVALHSNVGLMHASMAIYNAFADRVPMLIIGAAGPIDADKRRPWIDWIHTTADQPALVRPFVKWDDSPSSVQATLDALARAWDITTAEPSAPCYVVLDVGVQEQALDVLPRVPRIHASPAGEAAAGAAAVATAAEALVAGKDVVILIGRMGHDPDDYGRRIELAERLGARVITDLKAGSGFPTNHPQHVPGSGFFLSAEAQAALRSADVVLGLDWIDFGGTLEQTPADGDRFVIAATLDRHLHNGWSKDAFGRVDADVWLTATPDVAVRQLLDAIPADLNGNAPVTNARVGSDSGSPNRSPALDRGPITLEGLARAAAEALQGRVGTLVRLPLGWDDSYWEFDGPLDFLGYDGGGGIGSGPGMTIGAGLAAKGTGRVVTGILGDGDYLMGVNALWTAAKYEIPCLMIIANNRSYFNDEVHQERVAVMRDRDIARKWIGQRIDDPAPDLAALAKAQGVEAFGPVVDAAELVEVLAAAVALVESGRPVVVDVHVDPAYSKQMASGLVREVRTAG